MTANIPSGSVPPTKDGAHLGGGQPFGVVTSDGPGPEYDTDEKRQKVSDMYHAAEEEAAHSHEVFDNRVGYTTPENLEKLRAMDGTRSDSTRIALLPTVGNGKDPSKFGQI